MSRWRIRPARLGDVDLLTALERRAFDEASWGAEAVASGLTAPAVATFLAFPANGAEAAGFAMWRTLGEEAEILSIGVAPEHRRRGAAEALLAAIVAQAVGRGISRLFLEVGAANAAAIGLYAESGFERIAERKSYYRDGSDALVMRLNL